MSNYVREVPSSPMQFSPPTSPHSHGSSSNNNNNNNNSSSSSRLNSPDASSLISVEEEKPYGQKSVLYANSSTHKIKRSRNVKLQKKKSKPKGFKRTILESPLRKKIPRKKEVILMTERAKRGAAKTIAFMLRTLDKTPKLGKKGSRIDGKKPPFMPDRDLEKERKFLTSAGTDAFVHQQELNRNIVSRNSIRPGTAVSIASVMSDRIESQTHYVETRPKEEISAGRKRRLMENAAVFLDKVTTPQGQAKAKKRNVTMEQIKKWKEELKEDYKKEDLHRYAIYRDERKKLGLKGKGVLPPMDHKPQVKVNQKRIKEKMKMKSLGINKKKRKREKDIYKTDGKISSLPYYKKEPFDDITVPVDFKKVVRAVDPISPMRTLEEFYKRHPNVKKKILTDQYSAGSFIPNPSKLKISTEMKEIIRSRITNEANRDYENGFWEDPVSSLLASPYDANLFIQSETLGAYEPGTAPMLVTKTDPVEKQKDRNVPNRFHYVDEAHQAACIIQKMIRDRQRREHVAALSLVRIYRGYEVRRKQIEVHKTRESAVVIIQAFFRGCKDRVRVNFLRRTSWNMVALTCQRVGRGYLGRELFKRLWADRDFRMARRIQKRARGIIGRRIAAEWLAFVRQRNARKIQNVVRWFHFRKGYQKFKALFIKSVSLIQRVLRGYWGRKIAFRRKRRYLASIVIQRICCRGHLARKFCKRKMKIYRTACTVIQTRWRSIYARIICPKIRQDRIDEERKRRKLEERAVEIKVKEHLDYLKTKKGKKEFKAMKKEVRRKRKQRAKKRYRMKKAQRHMQDIQEAFELFDTDGSGTIDEKEFTKVTKELGIAMNKKEIKEAMGEMDEDGNGYAEFDEFAVWFDSLKRTGVKAAAIRVKLHSQKFIRDLFGWSVNTHTKQALLAKVRKSTTIEFRKNYPPPFQCAKCMKKFVFSYELERHLGKDEKCPGLYAPTKAVLMP